MSRGLLSCTLTAFDGIPQGQRIRLFSPVLNLNADTPLARANPEAWLGTGSDYRGELGIEASQPMEQAFPLVFLCSDAASAITGITLVSDAGWGSSALTGAFPPAEMMGKLLFGRISIEEFMEQVGDLSAFAPSTGAEA